MAEVDEQWVLHVIQRPQQRRLSLVQETGLKKNTHRFPVPGLA